MSTEEIRALEEELRRHRNLDSYKRDCPYCMMCGEDWPCPGIRAADALALLVAVAESAEPFADSEPFRRAAEMRDPGRVPCFVNTEWATALRDALAALAEAKQL